jgi:asparagine synthase (glutamine-hydrolysing)
VPGFVGEIDREALAAYLRYSYVPAPRSIFRGIQNLEPGTILTVRGEADIREEAYWSLAEIAFSGRANQRGVSDVDDGLLSAAASVPCPWSP